MMEVSWTYTASIRTFREKTTWTTYTWIGFHWLTDWL